MPAEQAQQAPQGQQRRSKVWLSWSSGKDCSYALHVLRQDPSVEVVGLMTSVNQAANRVAMHAVRAELLEEQAAAVGLPVYQIQLPFPCTNEAYEAAMRGGIEAAKAAGVEAIAFGDIHLADVRAYREEKMAGTGLGVMFPLWGRDTKQLSREIVSAGIRAVLTSVDPKSLDPSFAGRAYDATLLGELPSGVDPCGENGEFHTFVHAAPFFSRPVQIHTGIDPRLAVQRGGFFFYDVVPLSMSIDEAAEEAARAQAEAAAADAAAAAAAKEEGYQCPVHGKPEPAACEPAAKAACEPTAVAK